MMDLTISTPWQFVTYTLILTAGIVAVGLAVGWGLDRRLRRQADRAEAERRRQWALEQQLRDLEQQIWRESLSAEQREALEEAEQRRVAIRREARRRLGLPAEEESPPC